MFFRILTFTTWFVGVVCLVFGNAFASIDILVTDCLSVNEAPETWHDSIMRIRKHLIDAQKVTGK